MRKLEGIGAQSAYYDPFAFAPVTTTSDNSALACGSGAEPRGLHYEKHLVLFASHTNGGGEILGIHQRH